MSGINRTIRQRSNAQRGSALLMALVITVILFIMGLMFVSTTQTEKSAVSGLEEQNTLETGLDAVIDQINTVLVDDLFGVGGIGMLDGPGDSYNLSVLGDEDEYWDYPGPDDPWLASLEPEYTVDSVVGVGFFYWRHITDLYGDNFGIPYVGVSYFDPDDANIMDQRDSEKAVAQWYWVANNFTVAKIISDTDRLSTIIDKGSWNTPSHILDWGARADADGDGVADSRWVKVPNITGPQGQNVYTAVRIIDNGGMININTAYMNDNTCDGSQLTHISLLGMPTDSATDVVKRQAVNYLHSKRAVVDRPIPDDKPYEKPELDAYYYNVSLCLDSPQMPILMTLPAEPFDISDELELRNRYFLNSCVTVGLETVCDNPSSPSIMWATYLVNNRREIPLNGSSGSNVQEWFNNLHWISPQLPDKRHLLTAYSWDRTLRGFSLATIPPVSGFAPPSAGTAGTGVTMESLQADINNATAEEIATALIYAYQNSTPAFGTADQRKRVAQLACNIVDYRDSDSDVTYLHYAGTGSPGTADEYVFGNEAQPFFKELIATFNGSDPNLSVYTLELHNPFSKTIDLSDFKICKYDDENNKQGSDVILSGEIDPDTTTTFDYDPSSFPDLVFAEAVPIGGGAYKGIPYTIAIVRTVASEDVILDKHTFKIAEFPPGDEIIENRASTSDWKGIWEPAPALNYNLEIANELFKTVGEVTKVLTIGPSNKIEDETVGEEFATSASGIASHRLDMADSANDRELLSRLTVITRIDGIDNNGDMFVDDRNELRLPGRININTAPQRVIKALPWVSRDLATAMVLYRDRQSQIVDIDGIMWPLDYTGVDGPDQGLGLGPGFKTTGELLRVTNSSGTSNFYDIQYYAKNSGNDDDDPNEAPCFDPIVDTAIDDLEERDVLFHRVSNLVTVRSDVFTAYILVRVGERGPGRRVIAIFDRSNVFSPADTPKLVAIHPVPDPR